MARAIDPELWERWRRRLEEFEDSDLTVAEFCQYEGVSTATFYNWRKKLRRDASSPGPVPVANKQPAFVPVVAAGGDVVVSLPNGVRLDLPAGDHALIAHVLQTAAAVPLGGSS